MAEKKLIHVVAGVLRDREGKILLTQRPAGKHLAGLWEFPGGKREAGETPEQALRRELHEEIGVDAGVMRRLIRFPWRYPEKSILLDVYDVAEFVGEPHGKEGQALRWEPPHALSSVAMPAADVPVVNALRLPDCYAITPEPSGDDEEFFARLSRVLASGIKLVQLRAKTLKSQEIERIARRAHALTRRFGAALLLNEHIDLSVQLGLDGAHLTASQVRELSLRPGAKSDFLIAASCHSADELRSAVDIGADFAVLGPLNATTSHPDSRAIGWDEFAETIADVPLPVYALGGLGRDDLATARRARAQGVAAITGFWPARD